jgi:hypothetical protein
MINLSKIVNTNLNSTMASGKQRLVSAVTAITAGLILATSASAASSELITTAPVPGSMIIDLLPGNPDNSIDLGRQRVVSIAILGSASFDINDLNPRTLKLRAVSQNLVGKSDKSLCRQLDLNEDTYMDLLCDFKIIGFKIQPGDIPVVINAGTYQRQSLSAEGVLRYQVE